MTLEICTKCDQPTGKAGVGDGSLYCGRCEAGPFCGECYHMQLELCPTCIADDANYKPPTTCVKCLVDLQGKQYFTDTSLGPFCRACLHKHLNNRGGPPWTEAAERKPV